MPRLLAVLAALLLLLAGCGGDDDGDGGDTLSKSEAVEQADDVCADLDKQLGALEEPDTLADLGPYIGRVEEIARDGLRRLRALKVSDEDKSAYDAYLREVENSIRIAGFVETAAKDGKEQEARVQFGLLQQQDKKADAAAKRFGFKECGSGD
jgi:hypothetical protein